MAASGRTDAWRRTFRFPALALAFLAAPVLLPPAAQAEPNLTFSAPANSRVSGNVHWSAVAGGPRRIAKVELLVDGAVVETDRSAPYGGWWDTNRDFDGNHELHVRAYDVRGKAATRAKSVEVVNARLLRRTSPAASRCWDPRSQVSSDRDTVGGTCAGPLISVRMRRKAARWDGFRPVRPSSPRPSLCRVVATRETLALRRGVLWLSH